MVPLGLKVRRSHPTKSPRNARCWFFSNLGQQPETAGTAFAEADGEPYKLERQREKGTQCVFRVSDVLLHCAPLAGVNAQMRSSASCRERKANARRRSGVMIFLVLCLQAHRTRAGQQSHLGPEHRRLRTTRLEPSFGPGTTVLLEARQDGQEVMMSPARYCFNRFELGEASKTSRTSAKRSLHRGFGNTGRASAGYHCHLSPKLHCRVASLPAFHRRQPPCRTERVVSSNYDRRRSRLWVFALGIWLSDFGLGVSGSSINLSRPFTAIARFFFRKTRPCPPFSAEPAS